MLFKDVYSKYCQSVYRYLLSLTGEENLAEELVQETFYRAFLNIDSFKGESSMYTWLCQIGKNAWYKECKRRKRFDSAKEMSVGLTDDKESVESSVIKREQAKLIMDAMDKLESPYVDVFIMRVYGEKKLSEIAKHYGKSESWARVTYYRAKAKIIEIMEETENEI